MSSRRRPPANSSAPFSPFDAMDEVTPHRQMSSTAANPASLATSPFSPFPFGTPITHSRRSVLNPGPIQNASGGHRTAVALEESQQTRRLTPIQTRVRLRGRDMYGGPIVYGVGSAQSSSATASSTSLPPMAAAASMASSLRRSNRLLSAAPYNASMRIHNRNQRPPQQQQQQQLNYSTHDHDDYSHMDSSGISSTAKVILDTLDKMSTPIRDAQRIPLPAARAETRRAIAEQLLDRPSSTIGGGGGGSAGSSPTTSAGSESSSSYSRRRPRLGRTEPVSTSNASGQLLNGPPLRTLFSPVSSSVRGAAASRCERNGDALSASVMRLSGDESMLTTRSSKTVPTASLASSSWQKKSTYPFSVPALQPTTKSKDGVGTAASGKIRTKVGEKAKMRAEKALFDDAGGGGGGNTAGQPPHLKNATETINPFMKMNAMPQFNFAQESIIRSESGRNNAQREGENSTAVAANKSKTPSSINPLPVSSNSVNFSFPTTDPKMSVDKPAAAAITPAPPASPAGAATFVFTRPMCVSHPSASSALDGSGRFSYAFSDPVKPGGVSARSQRDLTKVEAAVSSPSSLISPSSRRANLPDLTNSASSGGTVNKLAESQAKRDGITRAAMTLKSASVMDILSGNGNHKLPDVAASAGKLSSPVKILAQETVLDILGQESRNGSDSWNFSQPRKPWQ